MIRENIVVEIMTIALVQHVAVQEHPVQIVTCGPVIGWTGVLRTLHLFSPTGAELPGTDPGFPQGSPHRTGTGSACYPVLSPLLPSALLPQHILELPWTSPCVAPFK